MAAADRDKQPMCLIGTTNTTITLGQEPVRHFTIIRADGNYDVWSETLAQWHIHTVYCSDLKAVYKQISQRQGVCSFEDSLKTHRWWLWEFHMLFGMSLASQRFPVVVKVQTWDGGLLT